jgi:hypothetical protein
VHSPKHGFPMSYVLAFIMFSDLRSEVVVHFVNVGGIVDYHCIRFLFIINPEQM